VSRIVVALTLLLTSCLSSPDRPRSGRTTDTGGAGGDEEGTGGKATGGKGTGGKATGGSATGGSATGGNSGDDTGGTTGKPDAAVDSGGSLPRDSGAPKLDASRDFAAPTSAGTWDNFNLVLANCVYCHNDPSKRLNLQYEKLYERLVNGVAEKSPANCPTRIAIVPGDPMQSLIYLKVSGKMSANCGARMPFNKPMITAMELKIVYDWIAAGAPMK
jgi:hypothetical protein